MNKMKKTLALLLLLPLVALAACGVAAPPSETFVHVGAGPIESPHFKDCVPAGTRNNAPTNDDYYGYPVSEREIDATGQAGSDQEPPTVVSKDNATLAVPITIRFQMISDCVTLQKFFKAYGQRYGAYLDDKGQATEGWNLMLRKLMYDPTDVALAEIAKKYTWRELYNSAQAQADLQNTLKADIGDIVDNAAGGRYFDHFIVLMKKPYPVDKSLAKAIAREQAAVAGAESAKAKAEAQKATAEAQTATAKAEAARQEAEIKGYGGFENYNKAKAVDKGLNPYQPTYVVNGSAVPTR